MHGTIYFEILTSGASVCFTPYNTIALNPYRIGFEAIAIAHLIAFVM